MTDCGERKAVGHILPAKTLAATLPSSYPAALTITLTHDSAMRRYIMLTLMSIIIGSCTDNFTFSGYPCYLVIDNSIHQDPTLASAMSPTSPGVFCQISADEVKHQYQLTNNYGQSSVTAYTAVDLRLTRDVGMNNAIIVGYGTLTGLFYAYDRECPNCFVPDAIPMRSKPLTIGQDGMATCAVCKRRYDMNNGGNCVYAENEGDAKGAKGMTRYRGSTTGPFGRLAVSNN